MRRSPLAHLCGALALLVWLGPAASRAESPARETPTPRLAAADNGDTTVYVTRTGTKYHRATCRTLRRSKRPMRLADAAKRYDPCRICKPPTLTADDDEAAAARDEEAAIGLVERVVDGDTVVVTGIGTVRLIGVDTPETVHPRQPVEAFGREAARFLERLTLGQRVRLTFDQARIDRYGRTLAYLHLDDGTFVNAEIVRQGAGFAYTKYPFRFLETFRRYQREAREAGRGLWGDGAPE